MSTRLGRTLFGRYTIESVLAEFQRRLLYVCSV